MLRSLTPSQEDVLRQLDRTPGATPEAIAAATSLPGGGICWNPGELERRGFVEHDLTRDEDGINGLYRLTPRGRAALGGLRSFDRPASGAGAGAPQPA